jgi:hypothetical protein
MQLNKERAAFHPTPDLILDGMLGYESMFTKRMKHGAVLVRNADSTA